MGCRRLREQLRLSDANAAAYLAGRGHLRAGETATLEPAGDGNINWVRRARIGPIGAPVTAPPTRTLVLKQARGTLERFPEYAVTTERIVFEARYYDRVRPLDRTGICPEVLDFDERERVLVLEDLGSAERLDHALARGPAAAPELVRAARALGGFLGAVHAATAADASLAGRFANDDMRRLHGDHVFALPFRPNEFPLSPALRGRAQTVWADAALVSLADAAYARYLEPRGALVHGDVQAGNVLLLPNAGPKLLDAEIAHLGDPAFDVGILLAHLVLDAVARGEPRAAAPLVEGTWAAYAAAESASCGTRLDDAVRYAGIELLRRTLGAARVAAVASDEAGLRVLDTALRWIRRPPARPDGLL